MNAPEQKNILSFRDCHPLTLYIQNQPSHLLLLQRLCYSIEKNSASIVHRPIPINYIPNAIIYLMKRWVNFVIMVCSAISESQIQTITNRKSSLISLCSLLYTFLSADISKSMKINIVLHFILFTKFPKGIRMKQYHDQKAEENLSYKIKTKYIHFSEFYRKK